MTATPCLTAGCGRDGSTRGYCERCYRRRLHTGRYGYRDASQCRVHVLALRDLGWTYAQIRDAAGTSTWVPHKIATGATRRVLVETETALLAVPLVPAVSQRNTPPLATWRRLEALQWMGWPMADIARRVGLKPYTLTTLRSRGDLVTFRVARAVEAVYDELAHLQGPSKQAATKARRRGYAPPLAWDDETISDPAVRPAGRRRSA